MSGCVPMDWGVLVMSRGRICDGTSSRTQMNLFWFCVLRVSDVLLCDLWRFFVSVQRTETGEKRGRPTVAH